MFADELHDVAVEGLGLLRVDRVSGLGQNLPQTTGAAAAESLRVSDRVCQAWHQFLACKASRSFSKQKDD